MNVPGRGGKIEMWVLQTMEGSVSLSSSICLSWMSVGGVMRSSFSDGLVVVLTGSVEEEEEDVSGVANGLNVGMSVQPSVLKIQESLM